MFDTRESDVVTLLSVDLGRACSVLFARNFSFGLKNLKLDIFQKLIKLRKMVWPLTAIAINSATATWPVAVAEFSLRQWWEKQWLQRDDIAAIGSQIWQMTETATSASKPAMEVLEQWCSGNHAVILTPACLQLKESKAVFTTFCTWSFNFWPFHKRASLSNWCHGKQIKNHGEATTNLKARQNRTRHVSHNRISFRGSYPVLLPIY